MFIFVKISQKEIFMPKNVLFKIVLISRKTKRGLKKNVFVKYVVKLLQQHKLLIGPLSLPENEQILFPFSSLIQSIIFSIRTLKLTLS